MSERQEPSFQMPARIRLSSASKHPRGQNAGVNPPASGVCNYPEQESYGYTKSRTQRVWAYFRRCVHLCILDWLMSTLYMLGNREMIYPEIQFTVGRQSLTFRTLPKKSSGGYRKYLCQENSAYNSGLWDSEKQEFPLTAYKWEVQANYMPAWKDFQHTLKKHDSVVNETK